MTALTRWNPIRDLMDWNPFRELEEVHNRLARLFNRSARSMDRRENITVAEWAPLVDITETDKEYLIKAELPEVRKDDVRVRVENGVLYISGERKLEKEEKSKRYHRIERSYGAFTRSFSLPADADEKRVTAEFRDGVLSVHVGKDESARAKLIEVKVA